jgi:hypothetical protein
MNKALIAAAAIVAVAGIGPVSAQQAGPTYSPSIHQSAGDRDSRGTPKYYQPARPYAYRHHYRPRGYVHAYPRSTTGAGPSGPYYENSIHQSAGERDSRGTPKYYQGR